MFDPGGYSGCLRGSPFLGGQHALLSELVRLDAAMVAEAGAVLVHEGLEHNFQEKPSDYLLHRTYCG